MAKQLRIAPACYHVLHLIPIKIAHEMNFFYDEGLCDEEGKPNAERNEFVGPLGTKRAYRNGWDKW